MAGLGQGELAGNDVGEGFSTTVSGDGRCRTFAGNIFV